MIMKKALIFLTVCPLKKDHHRRHLKYKKFVQYNLSFKVLQMQMEIRMSLK